MENFNSYFIHDIDESAYPHYYGFINNEGDWYIIREGSDASVRYYRKQFRSVGLYSEAWNDRTKLQYAFWETSF